MTRKRSRRVLGFVLMALAFLAACDSASVPRGGPQLPSAPPISAPGTGSPSPATAASDLLPVGFGFASPMGAMLAARPEAFRIP